MKRKIIHNLILLFYSWIIYNLWIFIMAHLFITEMGILHYIKLIIIILSSTPYFHILFSNIWIFFTEYAVIPLFFFFAGGITLFFWWRKQTIIRAWLLSLAGMVFGPGFIFYIIPNARSGPREIAGFYEGIVALNVIFLILLITSFLQKRFWPQNKFVNFIRSILQWPCLRI